MGGTTERAGCDISDMVLIHGFLRKMFRDGAAIVPTVDAADRARVRAVAAHLLELTNGLHNHHRTEDVLLWDAVAERSPGCALHVGLMRRQHEAMAGMIADTEEAVRAWRDGTGAGTDVEDRLHDLVGALEQHLGDEETKVLPEIARTFTQGEWNRVGETARKEKSGIPAFVGLGFLMDSMDPATAAAFAKATMPAPVVLLYRLVGRRQYVAYRRRVYGAAA